jgi:nitrous oxidase accessory protein NosD
MRSTTKAAAVVLVGVASLAAHAPAGAAESSIACGEVVTTDLRLTHDLDCPGTALVVGADDITVDLDGHAILGAGSGVSVAGIEIDAHDRVSIRDGEIEGFAYGVHAYDSDRLQLSRLEVQDTISGIAVEESADVRIASNLLRDNRTGLDLLGVTGLVVRNTTVERSDATGASIRAVERAALVGNDFVDNTFDGLALESVRRAYVRDNLVARNGLTGIYTIGESTTRYVDNLVVGNDDDGIRDSGDRSSWRANRAYGNGAVGLFAESYRVIDLGGNDADGNGRNCVGLRC